MFKRLMAYLTGPLRPLLAPNTQKPKRGTAGSPGAFGRPRFYRGKLPKSHTQA